jgi:hypothetical protein
MCNIAAAFTGNEQLTAGLSHFLQQQNPCAPLCGPAGSQNTGRTGTNYNYIPGIGGFPHCVYFNPGQK